MLDFHRISRNNKSGCSRTAHYLLHSHIDHLGISVLVAMDRREHHAIIEYLEAMQKLNQDLHKMIIDFDQSKDKLSVHFEHHDVKDVTSSIPTEEFVKICMASEANEKLYFAFCDRSLKRSWLEVLFEIVYRLQ